jgi:hypothetical protein
MSKAKPDFYHGVLAALAVVATYDYEALYHEIVATVGEKELVRAAVADEIATAEWAGLIKYGYCTSKGRSSQKWRQR